MAHKHSVYDTDAHFSINPFTRAIKNESTSKVAVIQHDHNSERFTFEIPRRVDGHDMSVCDRVEVHYINMDSTNPENISADIYEVDDLQVSPDDSGFVVCSWLLSQNATKYAGSLNFLVRFVCLDGEKIAYAWNTAIFTGISVSSGILNNAEEIIEPYVDVLAQWKADLFGVGDTQEQRLLTVSAEQQAAIAAKGAAVLDSIPDEYEALQAQADENTRFKAGAIVLDAEGESIVVHDASDCYLQGLKLFGKSDQVKTTGKNLFDINKEELLVVGSSGAVRYGYSFNNPGTYTFSCIGDNATSITIKVVSDGVYGEYKTFVLTANYTVTLGEKDVLLVYRAEENVRLSEGIRNAQLEVGSVATEYEPYSGGVASPTPAWSQEINSVENASVMVYGKNLLKPKSRTETINGVTFVVGEDGSVTASGTATKATFLGFGPDFALTPGESYILSGCPEGGAFDTYMLYLHYKNSGLDVYNRTGETKFTAKDEVISSVVVIYEGVTVSNLVFRPMIRLASVENGDYETYTEQTISVPRTLPGIPVSNGGNYTDENGQQWICDEVDLKRGVYVQRVGKIVFDENQSYHINAYQLNYGYFVFGCTKNGVSYSEAPMIADKLNFKPWGYFTADDIGNYICYEAYSFYISLADQSIQTVDAFREYLTANPITALYILATPIETALSDAEITAFRALHSNKPTTTILNDAGAFMAVEYVADTKTYIDNKIKEMMEGVTE